MAAASSISPSGMQLAGKYGMGVLSIASTSTEGLAALPLQWSFAEDAAREHGKTVDRRDWRVLVSFHLAESKQQAEQEAVDGLWWWHNEYNVRVLGRPGAARVEDKRELLAQVNGGGSGVGSAVIGTPDALVTMIRNLQQVTGGFGVVVGFAHDWAPREATLRSWELFARYVIPELNGYTQNLRQSADYMAAHRQELMAGRVESIKATVQGNEKAQAALAVTLQQLAKAPHGGGFRPGALPVGKRRKGRIELDLAAPGRSIPAGRRVESAAGVRLHPRGFAAPVAQLDRAPDYGSGGWEFESLRARQHLRHLSTGWKSRWWCYAAKESTTSKAIPQVRTLRAMPSAIPRAGASLSLSSISPRAYRSRTDKTGVGARARPSSVAHVRDGSNDVICSDIGTSEPLLLPGALRTSYNDGFI